MSKQSQSRTNNETESTTIDMESLGATVAEYSQKIGESVGEIVSNVQGQFEEAQTKGTDYIKENPYKSIVIASAVGFVLGGLFVSLIRSRD